MITGVLRERLQRRNEAVADITSSWHSEQNVIGPVFGIPYQYKFKAARFCITLLSFLRTDISKYGRIFRQIPH